MGQPAKPLDPDYDPVLAAFLSSPLVEFTDEERALIDEAKSHPGPMIPNEQFMAFVESLRPADEE
jgi:hypothetical protein